MEEMRFKGGRNLAMKIPEDKFEDTLHFYRDILLLETEEITKELPDSKRSAKVKFGENVLWLDSVAGLKTATIWMEVQTGNIADAAAYLKVNSTEFCDAVDQIPEGMHGIKDPAGVILLLRNETGRS